ncbi:Hypothetical protein IALB_2545 [Ignavibacterium album JCM 16511]|uniref:Uncharacterized protein n=1 Tax=Ignavibacterium album (strain DSM 19864 / JCM 16511 / NBRC 101810 / Mat9-16) TaxID=945713 RepID=I0AMP1_IGNAJ|nr:hypothetical protein [Ignavibacterium album]AFH50248.1 Hypothetical protein IALB_2545 [Ignavibacterium album JCM 16511]
MKIGQSSTQNFINNISVNSKINRAYSQNVKSSEEVLNEKEKQFFAQMFPDKSSEIMDYSFYGKSGKVNNIKIGSHFDRRG